MMFSKSERLIYVSSVLIDTFKMSWQKQHRQSSLHRTVNIKTVITIFRHVNNQTRENLNKFSKCMEVNREF